MTRNTDAPIVAELGRPETPQEAAERKAESSQNHRKRRTVNNFVYSLLATLVLVAIIVLTMPQAAPTTGTKVNYSAVAAQGKGAEPDALASPKLPATWTSNSAELRTGAPDNIDSWYIGLITPSDQYIGLTQAFKANDTWLANLLKNSTGSGAVTIDGIHWTVYNNRQSSRDVGNVEYALTTKAGASTYILLGTAKTAEFDTVAKALASQIKASSSKSKGDQ